MTRTPPLALACALACACGGACAAEGFWDDPAAGARDGDADARGDDDDDGGAGDDASAPPLCQSSSAPFLLDAPDGLLVLQQRTAYDAKRGTLLVAAMFAGQDQHGFRVSRVALDGTVIESRDILPDLSRGQALPVQLEYAPADDVFGLVLLLEHINQGGELRFVRLDPHGAPIEEPALFDTFANQARVAWDEEDRTWGLAWTRQGDGGRGELVATAGNPPLPDEGLPVLGTTEHDYNQGANIGRCSTGVCADAGAAFVVQDGFTTAALLDARGAPLPAAAGPAVFGDFDATLLDGRDAFFAVSVLGGGEGNPSALSLAVAPADDGEGLESRLQLPGDSFTGKAFLEPDGGVLALAWGQSGAFDVARATAGGWTGVRLRHAWGTAYEGRVITDVMDAVLTARGLLAVHTPPARDDGTATPGLVVTHVCAP